MKRVGAAGVRSPVEGQRAWTEGRMSGRLGCVGLADARGESGHAGGTEDDSKK